MRACLVYTGDQEPNAVRPLAVMLSIRLSAVANRGYGALDGEGASVSEAAGQGLGFQEVGEDAGVGC